MADVTYCIELPLPAETSKDGNNEPYRKAIWGRRCRSLRCYEARRTTAATLASSLSALPPDERGWITFAEARILFSNMDNTRSERRTGTVEETSSRSRRSTGPHSTSCRSRGGSISYVIRPLRRSADDHIVEGHPTIGPDCASLVERAPLAVNMPALLRTDATVLPPSRSF